MTLETPAVSRPRGGPVPLLRALRPRQWLKNLLVFIPMLAGHAISSESMLQSLAAFATFCMCASSAYLLNDALDASHDRLHKTKRHRPMAAGTLSLRAGLIASALLALAALLAAAQQSSAFFTALLVYFCATLLYSFFLKRLMGLDVLVLASLYVMRIVGGGAATGIDPSVWLLAFSFFLFLGLALLKRHSELADLLASGKVDVPGRGYSTSHTRVVGVLGMLASVCAALVFVLYIGSATVAQMYPHRLRLWFAVPMLLAWLARLWTLSYQRRIHEDPLFFVSKDPVSLALIAACVGAVVAAAR